MESENQPSIDTMNSELREIESMLVRAAPSAVPEHLLDRIEEGMKAPRARETGPPSKVVPFPGGRRVREARHAGSRNWMAAAAVAMLGALFAWFVPQHGGGDEPIVVSSQRWAGPARISLPASARGVMPAAVQSRIGGVRDEGVVWAAPGKAMRKIRVIYLDDVRARDDQGRTVEATLPRVQYVLVPEPVD